MLMQPNQTAEPQDPNRYDFFLNPPPKPKPSLVPSIPGVKDPFLKKILVLVGGGTLLIIIVVVLASVIFGGSSNSAELIKLAQQQNEMVRVSTEATPLATQQPAKSLAISVELSLTTSQQQLLTYLKQHHQKISSNELLLSKSAATDLQLTNAKAASNYDNVFAQIIQTQLQAYTSAIKQDFAGTSNAALQQLFRTEYQGGTLLLTQANNAVTALQAP
jgi:hypothetical protein